MNYVQRNSFFLSRGKQAWKALRAKRSGKNDDTKTLIKESSFARYSDDCAPLPHYVDPQFDTPELAIDYMAFARPSSCWSQRQKAAVATAVQSIKGIAADLASRDVILSVSLIPAGWAFAGENLIGKRSARHYRLAPETVITQAGLAGELTSGLEGIEVIDLEPVFRALKQDDPEKWYFPVDGHWTAHGQKRIAAWLTDHYRHRRSRR